MEAVTHLEKVIVGEVSAVTHLEKVITGETSAVTYTEKVITGEAPPITHLQKVIAGEASPVTHLEYVWVGGTPSPTEHEYTGAVPYTFNANGSPLISWRISGNTVQSTTPTPQNPIMPEGCGERTENLLQIPDVAETTKNGVTYHVNGNSLYINGTSTTAFGINIRNAFTLKAGTYTNQMYGFTGRRIYYSFNNVSTTMCMSDVNLFKTFTISEDTTYANALVWINNGVTFNNEKIDFALFEGNTPKEFDVYGYKIPISSANTTTPVYLGEVQTTRKIRKYECTGNESWSVTSAQGKTRAVANFTTSMGIVPLSKVVSTHYTGVEGGAGYPDINTITVNNNGTMAIGISSEFIDSNAWKSYLAAQYAAGTPVCVWYVLATEETGIVNEPLMKIGEYADEVSNVATIPTNNGSTTIDVDTTVKPSEIYIKYKGV